MSGQTPVFSVIATVRNEREGIEDFVRSLRNQTRAPDEIVIVDGASTDGTRDILERLAGEGAIRLISQPCNIAEGRNLGIRAARSPHIAVTDAGCRVDPDWLAAFARCFAVEDSPDVVAGNFRFDTHTPFEEAVVLATFSPDRENSPRAVYYPSSRSVAFLKAAWVDAGGYPEWLYAAEDTLFDIRLRQIGKRFVFCREAFVHWRPRSTWRALWRQRFNFARGNGRVGIGSGGYRANLRSHAGMLVALLGAFVWPWSLLIALALFALHVRRHLWAQATRAAQVSGKPAMRWRVLAAMEWTRLAGMAGYLAGRRDRRCDPRRYVASLRAWMGVDSVEEIGEP